MIRLDTVYELFHEEIAELRADPSEEDPVQNLDRRRAAIEKARSRAAVMAAFNLIAILFLFAFRPEIGPFLALGNNEQGLFTIGVLAVAVHAGYRLGQRQKLGALLRAWDSLPRRYDSAPAGRTE